MHIMTDRGWIPLAVKSIPAPRDRSMIEDFKWWFPGIQPLAEIIKPASDWRQAADLYLSFARELLPALKGKVV